MHSFIIHSSTTIKRQKHILTMLENFLNDEFSSIKDLSSISDPDIFILKPEKSIKIESVRKLNKNILLKPRQRSKKIIIILSANLLTLPAQHALLKTLEEPGSNTIIILELNNPYSLLPTIISRCKMEKVSVSLKSSPQLNRQTITFIKDLLSSSLEEKIVKLNQFSQSQQAHDFLLKFISYCRKKIRIDPSWCKQAEHAKLAIRALDSNVNFKLVLENFALSMQ